MTFRVRYRRRATRALAANWVSAADRASVTRASDHAERLLAADPLGHEESRSGNRRVLFVDPLAVFYSVAPAKRVVVVQDIRAPRLRPPRA
jgi:hypothetical protein